jgi:hypothetical protein
VTMARTTTSRPGSSGGASRRRKAQPPIPRQPIPEAMASLEEYTGSFPSSWGRWRMFLWNWLTIGDPTRGPD